MENQKDNSFKIGVIVVICGVLCIGSMISGFFMGQRNIRREAVDNKVASYQMVDQYGSVDFVWKK